MATSALDSVVHYLHRSLDSGGAARSDGDLLARFTADRDPAAFAELVRRYQAMVMNVCRRRLGDGADAEDAFQATFFVLARKARGIRKRDSVGCWLHGVAHRLSQQVLSKRAARLRSEEKLRQAAECKPSGDDPVRLASLRELSVILDDELRNLPTGCHAALVACHLEGLTTVEAAHRLGVAASTLKSRLHRGHELLRDRLRRRGVDLSAAALTVVLAEQCRAGAAPALVHATVQAALCVAGPSAAAKGGLAACAALLVALVGLGIGVSNSGPAGVAAAAEDRRPAGLDRLGDPLPPGAVARLGTTRFRQTSGVVAIAFAPDGKQLVTAGNHKLRVWDAATGKEVRQIESINVMGLASSPRGKVVAAAQNNNVEGWDVDTGVSKFRYQTPGFAAAVSADGRVLATGGRTGEKDDPVVLWDLRTGTKLRSLSGSMYQVFGLAFSPNGKSLAAVSCGDPNFSPPATARPEVVRLWEVETGRLHELEGHAGGATAVAFSADGKLLATGAHDGSLIWWDAASRRQLRKIKPDEEVYHHPKGDGLTSGGVHALAFAPNSGTLASAHHDGTVRLFETATGKQVRVLRGHAQSVSGVAFSPDGKTLASGSADHSVRLWDTATGAPLNPQTGHDGSVASVLVTPDGKRAVTAGYDRTLRIWNLATAKEVHTLREFKAAIRSVALSPDGTTLAAGLDDGTIQLRQATSGAPVRELKGHTGMVRSLSFSPDGKALASASPAGKNSNLSAKETQRSLRLWDVGSGREVPRIDGSRNDWHAHFSPDGKWLAAYDGAVVVRDAATGKTHRRLDGHVDFAFHPDGDRLVGWTAGTGGVTGGGMGAQKGLVRVVKVADGAELYRFEGPPRMPYIGGLFALSPDGRLLAVAVSEDGGHAQNVLQLWELSTGKLRRTLKGHASEVTSCAFSPGGRYVLTGSADTTALVWDLAGPKTEVTEKAVAALWDDLGDADAARADRAVWALVAADQQALPVLRKNLRPAPAPTAEWRGWVKDLDSEQFAVRDKAYRALESLGEKAYPVLQKASTDAPSLEVRRRIEKLLGRLAYPLTSPDTLREQRAVEVLEHLATPQARQLLQQLSNGAAAARLTDAAKASLERLAKRQAP